MSPARTVAFSVLRRVASGAYASDLLLAQSRSLDSRDAGLAAELVMGCLRRQNQLDWLITHFSGRQASALDSEVRIALRMGIYQLNFLDRVPRHAAVSESVDAVKAARKPSAAGLVNAVLRKVNKDPLRFPDRARTLALPDWLQRRWDVQFGAVETDHIAAAFQRAPQAYVRVPAGQPSPAGAVVEPTEIPGCYRLISGDPSPYRLQDIGSQSIVPLLDLQPGLSFLDLCAAPGNKTAQALEAGVRGVACELHASRLHMLAQLDCPVVQLDGTQPLPFRARFDRILIDAPCTGTGTLGRNPEIKWRIQPANVRELAALQTALLKRGLEQLAPAGRLVYSTCSLEREENEAVVAAALNAGGRYRLVSQHQRVPGRDPGDGFFAAVITSEEPVNG